MSVRVSSWYEEVSKYQERVASCLVIFITSVMKIHQFKSCCERGEIDRRTRCHAKCRNHIFVYKITKAARDRIPVGARFPAPIQTSPGAHPSSYTKGTVSYSGVKGAGAWRLPPTPSSAEVKERIVLYVYSHSCWAPVACSKMNFTFTIYNESILKNIELTLAFIVMQDIHTKECTLDVCLIQRVFTAGLLARERTTSLLLTDRWRLRFCSADSDVKKSHCKSEVLL